MVVYEYGLNYEEWMFLNHLRDIGSAKVITKRIIRHCKGRCRSCGKHSRGMLECPPCYVIGQELNTRRW